MANITSDITIRNINASADRGGWECQFDVPLDTDLLAPDQRLCVKHKIAFNGPSGVPKIGFNGFVLPNSFEFDRIGSLMRGVAQTSDGFLRRGFVQGLGFAEVAARVNYHQFNPDTMTLGMLVKHIMGYYDADVDIGPNWISHTNMVHDDVNNPLGWITLDQVKSSVWELSNPAGSMNVTDYSVREADNNLWSRLREIADAEFFLLYFDRNDVMHYHRNPMFEAVLPTPVMTFDSRFMIGKPSVKMYGPERPRQVLMKAINDETDVIEAEYPPSAVHVFGQVDELYRLRCNSRDLLEEWCRRRYLFQNREYQLTWTAPGACGLLFECLDRVYVTYAGTTENGVHINFNREPFWIYDISVDILDGFTASSKFVLEQEHLP